MQPKCERILFLTECGRDIGMGHLTRCVALANAFRKAGVPSELWVESQDLDKVVLRERGQNVRWSQPSNSLDRGLASAFGLLIDSYTVDEAALARLVGLNSNIAFLDDFPTRHYESGIVIDWTVGAEKNAFPNRHPGVRYLLGSSFCTLREAFETCQERLFPDSPSRALISCGGSDPRQMTGPVVVALQRAFPSLYLDVVVGSGFRQASEVTKLGGARTEFHTNQCDAGMRRLMAMADLAICGGGQTLYEAASQGLPAVAIKLIENQTADIRGFSEAGYCRFAGEWDAPGLLQHVVALVHELWPASHRELASRAGRSVVDGRGGDRLVCEVLKKWRRG